MHADAALSDALRGRLVSDSPLTGSANLLIMPTLDAANIGLTLLSARDREPAGRARSCSGSPSRSMSWCPASPRAASST